PALSTVIPDRPRARTFGVASASQNLRRSGRGKPPSVAGRGSEAKRHCEFRTVYIVPQRFAVLASRGKGAHRTPDGIGGDSPMIRGACVVALFAGFLLVLPGQKQVGAIFSDLQSTAAPGAAVMVIDHGQVVFQHGYGVAELRTRTPIDEHTNFRLASDTKQFTAMAVMLLVHDGKLRYDERLTEVFPEFPAYGKNITIRELLNHTSGLLDYEDLMPKYEGVPPE